MGTRKPVVLVVDDEAGIRDVLADLLSMEGFQVMTAANGRQGLEACLTAEPDLVITDVMMPKMNGVEMVLRLRDSNPRIKVIFMSGFFGIAPSRRDMTDAIASFGYPLLQKPFKPTEFLSQVHTNLPLLRCEISGSGDTPAIAGHAPEPLARN